MAKRCQDLLETDPAAAFRAAMAEWRYDREGLAAAAEALVKKDPEAARRLLAECPDLRSRNVLECALMADEVSRNPQEKLSWADSTLTGNVRIAALKTGLTELVKKDPAAALAFANNLPGSLEIYNVINSMLRELMNKDPAQAIYWMSAYFPPDELGTTRSILLEAYLKDNPGVGPELMSTLSPELQKAMVFPMVADSKYRADPAKPYFPQLLEQVHSLPPELQDEGLAALNWATEPGTPGRTTADLLSLLSDPRERSGVLRRIVGGQLRYLNTDPNAPLPDGLDLIQTPADKQEIARMLPWLKNLSESQRAALEARLK